MRYYRFNYLRVPNVKSRRLFAVGGAEAEIALMSAWRSVGTTFLPNASKNLAFACG